MYEEQVLDIETADGMPGGQRQSFHKS
jgi:hypothetical protein